MAHVVLSIAVLSSSRVDKTGEIIKPASVDCRKVLETTYLETISFPLLEEASLGSDSISVEVTCVNK